MKSLLACLPLALLLACAPALVAGAAMEPAPIRVAEVPPSHILPHAFYDQAIASIPGVYPGSEILEGARFRQSGALAYAYLAYRTAPDAATLRLEMMATDGARAWHLSADVPPAELESQREALLQKALLLADSQPSTCAAYPLPEPASALPAEAPPAGPYERLSVYNPDLDLGLGHLRPADESRHVWDWHLRAGFPLFAAPGGELTGWIANGWRVDAAGKRTALGTAGMLETGYETPSFLVLRQDSDGWLQIRLAPPGDADDVAWVHPCHLAQGALPLLFEPWEELFRRVETPLFFRRANPHHLRAAPAPTAAILLLIPAEDHRYQLDLLEVAGDWMKVRVTEPPSFCAEDDRPRTTHEGWIQWRDGQVGPWLWYPTRGC